MASVGNVICTFVKGEAPQPKQRVALWQVPGIAGYGARLDGLGDSEFQLTCVLYSTYMGVREWSAALHSLQGSLVVVINDWGNTFSRCLLRNVSPPRLSTAHHAGGCRAEITIDGVVT